MIIFAALLAFVVQPAIGFFRRRWNMKRGSAIGLAYLLVIALLILIPLIIIPAVIQSLNGVLSMDWQAVGQEMAASLQTAAQNTSSIPVIGPEISATLDALSQFLSGAATLPTPAPVVVDVSASALGGQLGEMLGKLAKVLGPLISAFVSIIFMLLISLRMSLALDEMRAAYPKLIPPSFKNEIIALVERIINVWVSFLRGQLSLMVVMGFLVFLLNLVLGTPYPLFLGILAGVLEIIPSLGPILATIPAVILALVVGSSWLPVSNLVFAIIVIAGYVLLSGLENQVLVPKILGDAVELPPLVVIIGCVIGGAAFGLLGVFLATPVISTGKELFSYLYNKILEPPPEIKPPEEKPSLMSSLRGLTRRIRNPFRRREKEPAALQSPASTNEPATE
jgi:predicted PurR-regulated permease PerM